MTVVFVHGVPETPAVWDPLRSLLGRDDVEALRLPGFGTPRPDGFVATKESYVSWLETELERVCAATGPVDLVGHDWGGGFVVRLVSTRPELVRSWATDAAGIGDPGFEWHDFAKIWQTPGDGEEFFEQQLAQPLDGRAAGFELFGLSADSARTLAGWLDAEMAQCILTLYRSAVDVGREWGPDFRDIPAPGLVVLASEDAFLSADGARSAAATAGARVTDLPGLGHWWMLQDPGRGAAALSEFWATLD
jgi:pimeloyl-ACP methyl ester carboxylesterase